MARVLEYKNDIPEITAELENGMYILDHRSGIGKTYLYRVLTQKRAAGYKVCSYSYNERLQGIALGDKLVGDEELIMIDRYDLFEGEFAEKLVELSDNAVVLVACQCACTVNSINCAKHIAIIDTDFMNYITLG